MISPNLQNTIASALAPEVVNWDHLGPTVVSADGTAGYLILKRAERQGYQTGYQFSVTLGRAFPSFTALKQWYEEVAAKVTTHLYPNLGVGACVVDGAGRLSITSLGAIEFASPSASTTQARQTTPVEFIGGINFTLTVTLRGT